eukprot:223105-Prorocentrum_minimum.AAC.4
MICTVLVAAEKIVKKKKKRFVYRNFAQRVAAIDVNVFKRVGQTRAEPLSGSETFFQVRCSPSMSRPRDLDPQQSDFAMPLVSILQTHNPTMAYIMSSLQLVSCPLTPPSHVTNFVSYLRLGLHRRR